MAIGKVSVGTGGNKWCNCQVFCVSGRTDKEESNRDKLDRLHNWCKTCVLIVNQCLVTPGHCLYKTIFLIQYKCTIQQNWLSLYLLPGLQLWILPKYFLHGLWHVHSWYVAHLSWLCLTSVHFSSSRKITLIYLLRNRLILNNFKIFQSSLIIKITSNNATEHKSCWFLSFTVYFLLNSL